MLDKQSSPPFVLRCLGGRLETVQCSSADRRRFGGGVYLHSLITSASALQGVQTVVSQWVGESFTELNMTYNQVNVRRWTLGVHFYGYCVETIIKFVQGRLETSFRNKRHFFFGSVRLDTTIAL